MCTRCQNRAISRSGWFRKLVDVTGIWQILKFGCLYFCVLCTLPVARSKAQELDSSSPPSKNDASLVERIRASFRSEPPSLIAENVNRDKTDVQRTETNEAVPEFIDGNVAIRRDGIGLTNDGPVVLHLRDHGITWGQLLKFIAGENSRGWISDGTVRELPAKNEVTQQEWNVLGQFGLHESHVDQRTNATVVPNAVLGQISRLYPDAIQFRFDEYGDPTDVIVNGARLQQRLRSQSSGVRRWLAQKNEIAFSDTTQCWPPVTESAAGNSGPSADVLPDRVLVILGGLHSVESTSEHMARRLGEAAKSRSFYFRYPNDGSIAESANLLRQALDDLRVQYPAADFQVIAHSMGGLVSRYCLEAPAPKTIDFVSQLILVCPPNHGSVLAQYSTALEGFEQLFRVFPNRTSETGPLPVRVVLDGLGEASQDLVPGSRLLMRLNSFPRNPHVRYTILAGDNAPLNDRRLFFASAVWKQIDRATGGEHPLKDRFEELLYSEEIRKNQGDGVVSIQSAQLPGVQEFSVLDIHHMTWSQSTEEAHDVLVDTILNRLTGSNDYVSSVDAIDAAGKSSAPTAGGYGPRPIVPSGSVPSGSVPVDSGPANEVMDRE